MAALSWFRRHGTFRTRTRKLGDWQVLEVSGKFVAGPAEKKFLDEVDGLLRSGARRVVVDMSDSLLADDTVAGAAQEAYHKAKIAGTEMRFVVQPGAGGGFYHMAGLEMEIPTFHRLTGAIEI